MEDLIRNFEFIKELKNNPEKASENAKRYLEILNATKVNIGVIGNSGSGKSSLINALLGLYPNDEGSAQIGYTETTRIPMPYRHPVNGNILLWDLPGVSPSFPLDTYFDDIKDISRFRNELSESFVELDKPIEYDMFIICCKDRFQENDLILGQRVTDSSRNYFLVRTHMDDVIKQWETRNDRNIDDQSIPGLIVEIKDDIKRNFFTYQLSERKLFAVSSLMIRFRKIDNRNKFEFSQLQTALASSEIKQEKLNLLILAFVPMTKDNIREKCATLRERIKHASIISATAGLTPIPLVSISVDIAILANEVVLYMKSLYLFKSSLEDLSNAFGINYNDLYTNCIENNVLVRAFFASDLFTSKQGLAMLAPKAFKVLTDILVEYLSNYFIANTIEESIKLAIPIVGSIVGATISGFSTYYALHCILSELEKLCLEILDYCQRNRRSYYY